MSSITHLAKLAAAALLGSRLWCSGWRHGVGRLRRTPSHSRRAGARLLALGSDKAGAKTPVANHMPQRTAGSRFSPHLIHRSAQKNAPDARQPGHD